MPKLSANTVLVNPKTGVPEALMSGDEIPEWAADLVGDHLIADEKPKSAAKPAASSAKK